MSEGAACIDALQKHATERGRRREKRRGAREEERGQSREERPRKDKREVGAQFPNSNGRGARGRGLVVRRATSKQQQQMYVVQCRAVVLGAGRSREKQQGGQVPDEQ